MTHPPIYTMTLDELEVLAAKGGPVVDPMGNVICSRDRNWDRQKAHYLWSAAVDNAIYEGKLDPKDNPKGADAPKNIKPKKEAAIKDPRPYNKPAKGKPRPFSWSYSALNNFLGCPLRYAQEKFYCTLPWQDSAAIRYGNAVHEAAENRLKGEKYNPDLVKPIEKYLQLFEAKRTEGCEVVPELEIVLDRNLKPLTGKKAWFSKGAWYRGKLDVVVIQDGKAGYYDWKTGGKVRDDQEQLKICCAALSILRPDIETFTPKLIWTKHDTVTGIAGGSLDAESIKKVWEDTLPKVERMEEAWRTEVFPARPSGLCGWCGHKTKCVYGK